MDKIKWNSIDKKENGLKYSKNYKSYIANSIVKSCFNKKYYIIIIIIKHF